MALSKEQLQAHKMELHKIASGEAKLCLPRNEEGGVRMGVMAAEVGLTILAGATDGYGTGLLVAGIFAVANRLHNGNKTKQILEQERAEREAIKQELLNELKKVEAGE